MAALYVRDPFGHLTPTPGGVRTQLTSSADLAPLLLTIGTGGNGWRSDGPYTYLVDRADVEGVAANYVAGRPWIAHATDGMSVEDMATLLKSPIVQKVFGAAGPPTDIPTSAPGHVVAVRTADAKFVTYSYWRPGTMTTDTSRPVERELYDYATVSGAQELDDQAGRSAKQAALQDLLDHQVIPELTAPPPKHLDEAQQQGLANMRELSSLRGG